MLVTVRVLIVVLADEEPLDTVSDEGTGTALLLLESETVAPPLGALPLSFTVSVTWVDPPMDEEENTTWLNVTLVAGEIVRVADALLVPIVADMVAVVVLDTEVVVIEKFADVDPAGTVTVEGTLAAVLLEERATTAPPDPAACVSFTVPVELAPPMRDDGESTT